jgi:hypothetical protein
LRAIVLPEWELISAIQQPESCEGFCGIPEAVSDQPAACVVLSPTSFYGNFKRAAKKRLLLSWMRPRAAGQVLWKPYFDPSEVPAVCCTNPM